MAALAGSPASGASAPSVALAAPAASPSLPPVASPVDSADAGESASPALPSASPLAPVPCSTTPAPSDAADPPCEGASMTTWGATSGPCAAEARSSPCAQSAWEARYVLRSASVKPPKRLTPPPIARGIVALFHAITNVSTKEIMRFLAFMAAPKGRTTARHRLRLAFVERLSKPVFIVLTY